MWWTRPPARFVELGDRLLLPTYGGPALNLASLARATRSTIALSESRDGGRSWIHRPVRLHAPHAWLQEPALAVVGDRWILHIRSADGESPSTAGPLLSTRSDDGGMTWSEPRPLPFVGHAPDLLLLANGALVSAFREVSAEGEERVSMITSLDCGESWSEPLRVETCGDDCGYPSLLELEGDRLLVVYYGSGGRSIEAAIYPFRVTHPHATRSTSSRPHATRSTSSRLDCLGEENETSPGSGPTQVHLEGQDGHAADTPHAKARTRLLGVVQPRSHRCEPALRSKRTDCCNRSPETDAPRPGSASSRAVIRDRSAR